MDIGQLRAHIDSLQNALAKKVQGATRLLRGTAFPTRRLKTAATAKANHPAYPINIREAGQIGRAALIEAADDHARSLFPLLRTLRNEGAITIGAITRSLNDRKVPTPRGSRWHVSTVANLLARAQRLDALR